MNLSEPKIGIIIPAFNPKIQLLKDLISRILVVCKGYPFRILVVDDGSIPAVPRDILNFSRLKIIRHQHNLGKGAALKSGFCFYLEKQGCDLVLTMDADLQHPPESIPAFLNIYMNKRYELIVGYRLRQLNKMPFHRILSNSLTSLIISMLSGQLIRDSQCGFRLINTKILRRIRLHEDGFHLESELLIKAGWHHIKIGSASIPTIYRQEESAIRNVGDTLRFISLILRLSGERFLK